jgi:hypothetical protein
VLHNGVPRRRGRPTPLKFSEANITTVVTYWACRSLGWALRSEAAPTRKEWLIVLDDAELLLGVSRHLSAFAISPAHAALESLQYAGQVYEMAWRLRNSQVSSAERILAIGVEAKIGPRQLVREVLPTLEALGWVEVRNDPSTGQMVSVDAFIPPAPELIADAGRLLDVVMATPVQRAALALLRATSLQPLEREAALQAASDFGDDAAAAALRHLVSIGLVREALSDDGRTVVFNPNVWVAGDEELTRVALRAEDAGVREHVGALLEEVATYPGIPEALVTSTEQRWIDFAVAHGLVQRSVVQTSGGDEQRFLFSPHLGRDPFGASPTDPSGHVRQLVGSMIYAATFASWKLLNPGGFLYTLIRDGEAGNVPNIGEDYPMLETAGTIRVVKGRGFNNYKMQLLQADVAEEALKILDSRGQPRTPGDAEIRALGDQRSYGHVEQERAQLTRHASTNDADMRRMIDALRDVTARRSFGGR